MKSVCSRRARFDVERVGDYIYLGEKATCEQTLPIYGVKHMLNRTYLRFLGTEMRATRRPEVVQPIAYTHSLRLIQGYGFTLSCYTPRPLNEPTHCVLIRSIQDSITIHLYLAFYTHGDVIGGFNASQSMDIDLFINIRVSHLACYDFPRHTCRDPPSVASFMCNQFCWHVAGALMPDDRIYLCSIASAHQND